MFKINFLKKQFYFFSRFATAGKTPFLCGLINNLLSRAFGWVWKNWFIFRLKQAGS